MSRFTRLLGVLVLCAMALTGCAALADLGTLRTDLEDAGYDVPNINHNTMNGHSVLSLGVAAAEGDATEEDAGRIAEIVWTKYSGDFDELAITINGVPALTASADELTERFGERPDGSGEQKKGGSRVVVVIVVLIVAAVLAAIFVMVWLRGRRPPPPAQYPPSAYPYSPQR